MLGLSGRQTANMAPSLHAMGICVHAYSIYSTLRRGIHERKSYHCLIYIHERKSVIRTSARGVVRGMPNRSHLSTTSVDAAL
jgi:hypothetical protein